VMRTEFNLSRKEFANLLDITPRLVERWELSQDAHRDPVLQEMIKRFYDVHIHMPADYAQKSLGFIQKFGVDMYKDALKLRHDRMVKDGTICQE
jgi:transcriptional regulator with XRE-family HTH domain